ncbi:translation initiation factor [Segatella asaccharophila]|jgi:translation initiation factor 1
MNKKMTGTDWKSALAALGETSDAGMTEKKDVDRKKRVGVVYSTNPDFDYSEIAQEESHTLPRNQQKLRLNMERAGRGGKTVTLVKGFVGSEEDMSTLCKLLKQKCGVGGSVKDGEIIIQGDCRQRLTEILRKEGFSQTK